jgi:hypothetical protein
MAGHVGADAHVDFGRGLEVEVRVKTGDCVDLTDGYFQFPRQLVQLIGGQISERSLDGPKFVKHADLLAFAVPEPSLENGELPYQIDWHLSTEPGLQKAYCR